VLSFSKQFLSLLLGVLTVASALGANTQISTDKPIINFRLPTFTNEGYRAWLVRGSEARYINQNQIDIKELTLSVFSGKADDKIATMILSPSARVMPTDSVIAGEDTIRVIDDQLEATGTGWHYAHKEKKISITKNVRVTFRAEFKDFLK
jgi:lipopolysaccharide export system protein LptC